MRPRRLPVQPARRKNGRRGGSRGRDDRALEDGKRIPGFVAIEHQYRRGAWKASPDIAGKTGDPLQPGHIEAVPNVGRKRNDPAIGLVGKFQEVAVGVDGLPVRVREIRFPDDADAFMPVGADDIGYGLAVDDR